MLLGLSLLVQNGVASSGELVSFLHHPYRPVNVALQEQVASCTIVISESDYRMLLAEVQKAVYPAVGLGFKLRKCMSGGDLEDLSRSLGLVADRAPKTFLKQAIAQAVTYSEVLFIVNMLPEGSREHSYTESAALQQRKRSLQSVRERDVECLRDLLVNELIAEAQRDCK